MRQGEAGHAGGARQRHRGDEARRHQPQRAAAEPGREQADRHHGEDVVEAAERMEEPVDEACALMARMGRGDGGDESQGIVARASEAAASRGTMRFIEFSVRQSM